MQRTQKKPTINLYSKPSPHTPPTPQIIYTFLLCFVVLNVACSSASKDNQYYGLAIGSVIIAGGYAVAGISGAAFNPAVAFGIDLSSWNKGFGFSLLYTVFEFIGAVLAALVFR
jgi:aquaporin Z